MLARDRVFWSVVFAASIFGALLASLREPPPEPGPAMPVEPQWAGELPDFAVLENVGERKAAFFAFVRPFAEYHNQRLWAERSRLLEWQARLEAGGELKPEKRRTLEEMARHYRVKSPRVSAEGAADAGVIEQLLRRVDIVPVSLVLSQAATESGWGSSRFAVEGNNLFGIWCYRPGCGIVPRRRGKGANHEVAAFDTPAKSARAYFRIINTHPAYAEFRELRQLLRRRGEALDGLILAAGLEHYSERGEEYIQQIRGMIRGNDLARFDT